MGMNDAQRREIDEAIVAEAIRAQSATGSTMTQKGVKRGIVTGDCLGR
ncbi:MAG: hypothetical protein LUI13_01865 [Lachnospiraceae bacterium]|nr:hypothetical protein [Lachnospiraceae bacterium]